MTTNQIKKEFEELINNDALIHQTLAGLFCDGWKSSLPGYPDTSATKPMEYARLTLMRAIMPFIESTLTKREEEIRTKTLEEAYTMFLQLIKDAKNKFPNNKEFELVVDVRDIEKSLQKLKEMKK